MAVGQVRKSDHIIFLQLKLTAMKINSILFGLLLITTTCLSQKAPDPEKKRLIDSCDKFMKLFQGGKQLQAMQMLKTISLLKEEDIDKLSDQVESQLETIESNYGKMISYEFVKDKEVKDFILKRIYILRMEKFYLKFSFILYKSSAGWKVTGVNYNEDIEDAF